MASPSSDAAPIEQSTRTEYLWCLTIILGSLGWWFSSYLLHGYTFLSEAGQMLWADWVLGREHYFTTGGVSEWNPYSLFGVDWVGREAFLNPANVGALVGHLLPGNKFSFMAATLLFLALMGVTNYAFLRALGMRPAYARIGMVVYLLAPKWLDDGYHGPKFIVGYALLPLALLLIVRMHADGFGRLRHFVEFAVLVSLIYLGLGALFLVVQAYIIGSFFFYMVYRCWQSRQHSIGTLAARVGVGLIVAIPMIVGLSAFVLWPFWRNYAISERSFYGDPTGWGLAEYLGLVFPWVNRLFGRGIYDLPYPAVVPLLAPNLLFFVGILALPALAIGFARKLWTPLTGFFAVAFVGWLAVWSKFAIAVFPLLPMLERLANGSSTQNQGHIILVLSMSVILSSVLQQIDDRREDIRNGSAGKFLTLLNASLIAIYLSAAAVFLAGGLVFGTPLRAYLWSRVTVGHYIFAHYYFQECLALFVAIFLIRATTVWMYHRRLFMRSWGKAALLLLLIADFELLFRTSYPFTDMDARYDTHRMPNSFILERTGPLDRIGASQFQVDGAAKADRLTALVAMPAPVQYEEVVRRFGSLYYKGFKKPLYEPSFSYFPIIANRSFYGFHESLMPSYFWDFDRALNQGHPHYERGSFIGLWNPHSPLLDVAGIKYLFWHEQVTDARLKELARYANESRVYLNRQAVPRAYVVPRVEYYPTRPELMRRMQAPTFRPLEAATTEDRTLNDTMKTGQADTRAGEAHINAYTPNRVVVDVNAPGRSVLVLNDMYHPNWTVRINGVDNAMYRVNGIFRGVVVPEGASQVEFQYYNSAFHTGVVVSAATWLITGLVLVGTSRHFHRRRVEVGAPLPVS